MDGIFEWLYQMVHTITLTLGYPGIIILMLVENLFPPIPSEIVMPFAGFIASEGDLNLFGVLLAGSIGSSLGAVVIYEVGRRLGHARLRRWICRYGKFLLIAPDDLERALDTFNRHGKSAVFFGRLIPGVRSLISIPAGIKQMPMGEFLGLTLLGSLAWNAMLIAAGYLLGSNWRSVLDVIDTYKIVIYVIVGAVLVYFIARRMGRKVQDTGC